MKRVLSLFLIFALFAISFSVSAYENYFHSDGSYQLTGYVIGNCEIRQIIDEEAVAAGEYYIVEIDTNSTIVFETPVDTLYVAGDNKGDESHYDFRDGVKKNDGTCSVAYTPGYRYDSEDYTGFDIDFDNEVEYMMPNAELRFNKSGNYLMFATLGATSGEERISQIVELQERGQTFYSQPEVIFNITVTDKTSSENIYESRYDENIISLSGVTGYDYSRVIMGEHTIAMCSAPATVTASTDLANMVISKLENVNGEWAETRFLDGDGINIGDPYRNWIPGEGIDMDTIFNDPHFEYTGNMEYVEGFVPVKKGTSISLTEPGIYSTWAETHTGEVTGLTFEICDTYASYTDSKVLVDGKEIKFEAYNINDNNYFKLRDIAYVLSTYGAGGNFFNVKWDGERNMINLVSYAKYDVVGGELKEGDGKDKSYETSSSALLKDGVNVTLKAYLINGNNYFKLRDLGKLFDFNISWDGANNCILIDSLSPYIEP